ncbi:hypothetical protein BDZ94DRAFT_1305853 [Collybia nuda]|uniref:F-box domain-containing protein n=1 Tax=Collybia nuda TaxID=64659 RepID=A0A9P5YE43_9AGAR|nr:hypothetical protein BDZ94DRAFT_1305853 [Collybia nuda]
MPSTPSVPQEILDNIIDEARDDWETLNACSLVSRSFLPTSRKNLFYAITINSCMTSQGLHNLLISNSAIANYVQELTIVPHPKLSHSTFPGVPWVVLDEQLAPILNMLLRVEQLQLGDDTSHSFDWTYFTPTVQQALETQVCRLSGLSILRIFRIAELPIAPLLFAPIKQLSLIGVNIAEIDTEIVARQTLNDDLSMAQLETLDVLVYDYRQNPNVNWPLIFRCAPNLHSLSILSVRNGGDYGLRIARQLIEVAANSLSSIACLVYDDDLYPLLEHFRWPELNLGTIAHLTSLSFTFTSLSMNESPRNFNAVVNMLKDSFVTRNLEDLTFAFEMTYATCMWESRVILCSRYNAWTEFNHILEFGPGIPTLRNLKIFLYLTEPPSRTADAKLQSLLVSILPGLDEQIRLSCVTYSNDN